MAIQFLRKTEHWVSLKQPIKAGKITISQGNYPGLIALINKVHLTVQLPTVVDDRLITFESTTSPSACPQVNPSTTSLWQSTIRNHVQATGLLTWDLLPKQAQQYGDFFFYSFTMSRWRFYCHLFYFVMYSTWHFLVLMSF